MRAFAAVCVAVAIGSVATTGVGADGRLDQARKVAVTATVDAGGRHYEASGTGECHASAQASIYDNPAAMTSAMLSVASGPLSHINVTIWQLKRSGEVQVTLSTAVGSTTYDIATVRGAAVKGAATARVDRRGAGGTLNVEGRTAAGQALRVSVTCPSFTPPEDNG